jgi:hypothetical protein
MDNIIIKLKSLRDELSNANNGGILTGIYWRVSSVINNKFGAASIYSTLLKRIEDIDYDTKLDMNKGKLLGVINHVLE